MSREITVMKLSDLKRPERNVRMHTEPQLKEFERSVKMFGQIRPLVVDEDNTILAGNGLYETLLRLGREEADVYKMTGLTANEKKKLMLADNKVYSLGVDDLETFDAFLSEMEGDFDIPGFDEEILQSMMALPEDITSIISDYGLITGEEKEELTAAAEKKEEAMKAPPPAPVFKTDEDTHGERSETRRCVTCPNCGEEIWL